MIEFLFPRIQGQGGPRYWLRAANIAASQRKFLRADHSIEWRRQFETESPPDPPSRAKRIEDLLLAPRSVESFRFIVIGDTGEGDHSQYALLPLIRAVKPDFMIVNGDVAYPAGTVQDFNIGFFQPYAGLGIPIWATIGNHEYYSPNNGREFYQIFCTRMFEPEWIRSGLRLVPQPGTYWELSDPTAKTPLVIIGLDSGKKGNLDGHESLPARLNPFDRKRAPDTEQHEWLDARLSRADSLNSKVLVLFHIPGLVSGSHDDHTNCGELHRILLRHPSVRAVVSAHIHNHQQYNPLTFRDYIVRRHSGNSGAHEPPHYVVSGNGGATLDGTEFSHAEYPSVLPYPSISQWQGYRSRAWRALERTRFGRSSVARAVAAIKESVIIDDDSPELRCFLLFDVSPPNKVSASLIFMDDLQTLFSQQPRGTRISVNDPASQLDPDALVRCTRHLFDL